MSVGTYPAHQIDFAPGVPSSVTPSGGDWVDITSKVSEWSTFWGTQDEFTQPGAGTGDLLLDNADGNFDPDNSTGTYYGDLLPGMWFRITAGTTTADHDVFYAQVSQDGFQFAASQYPDSVVKVRLVDVAEFLANSDLPSSVYETAIKADAPVVWWRLGESQGNVATDASGNGNDGTYHGDATAGSEQSLIVDASNAAIGFDGVDDKVTLDHVVLGSDYTIEIWLKADVNPAATWMVHLLGAAGRIGVLRAAGDDTVRFNYISAGGSVFYESDAVVSDGTPHHILITQSGATTTIAVDGANGTNLVGGSPYSTTWGPMTLAVGAEVDFPSYTHGTLDEFALYGSALAGGTALAHYEAGAVAWAGDLTGARVTRILDAVDYDPAHRYIEDGASTLQAATLNTNAWAALTDVAKAENGFILVDHRGGGAVSFIGRRTPWEWSGALTSQVTIGDGGGAEVPAANISMTDDRIVNHAMMQRSGGAAVLSEDATSKTTYRKRSVSESGLLYQTDAESQARGERLVAEKKDRHRRVRSVTLEPRKSTHPAWAHVFARRMFERITVKWRPTYGGTRTYVCWIIGIGQRWVRGGGLTTTFYLAPVPFDTDGAPYWIAGVSEAGVDTRPGY